MITIFDKGAHIPLVWTHLVPATLEGRAVHNVQNAMFAAALAFSMGVRLEDIRHGLRTFDTTFFQAPGRMNVFDEHPFKVIVDYGHNGAAVEAMCQLCDRLEPQGRRIVVLAAPGDRRDSDITEIGTIAAGHFDHYIVRRDDRFRGRDGDEVPRMLRAALLAAGVPQEKIEVIPDEVTAVDHVLSIARPGDLLLVFADAITRTWKQVISFHPAQATSTDRPSRPIMVEAPVVSEPLPSTESLVRDERGVRIKREPEAED
jgi:cyanophycin synthetase